LLQGPVLFWIRAFVITVHLGAYAVQAYRHFLRDPAGWNGVVYPVAFNIHDDQPNTWSGRLRPTIHVNFAGRDFVICSFVPRKVNGSDRDRLKAIPCPQGHARVHRREIF